MSSRSGNSSTRSRTIKLFCPWQSKGFRFVALEESGLDLGTIARIFGLEPATLRLNGHLLSRGVDLISAVSWKSLLSFFAARGFSTGASDHDPIIINGKPFTNGRQNPPINEDANPETVEDVGVGTKRKPWLDDINLLKKRKMDEFKSGRQNPSNNGDPNPETVEEIGIGTKRKPLLDVNLLKKRKMDEYKSGKLADISNAVPSITQFTYRCINGSLKRPGEDEVVLTTATSKRR